MILNHCHVFPEGAFRATMDASASASTGTLPVLRDLMDGLGFRRAVAFAPFADQMEGDPNDWLLGATEGDERFIGFATLNPSAPGAPERLRALMRRGLRGVKLHPAVLEFTIDDPACEEFYRTAQELGAVLLFHTGVHGWRLRNYRPLLLDDVAQANPGLRIIIEHVGGYAFFHEALAVLQNNRNTYAGLASSLCLEDAQSDAELYHMPEGRFRLLREAIGAGRLVYGADYPYNQAPLLAREVALIRGECPDEADGILGENLATMLGR